MKSFIEAVEYTRQKKTHQTQKLKKSHFEEPNEELKSYIEEKAHLSFVGSNFNYLANWNFWHFIHLFIKDNKVEYSYLSAATGLALEANNWDFALGKISDTYKNAIPFDKSTMHLGQMLYMGWFDKAQKYGNLVLKMLYGKQYNGWIEKPLYPWFMIELFCRWQKITLDKRKLKWPDHLDIYGEALAEWDTADDQRLKDIVYKLSSFHIAQSDENVATDEYGNEFSPEFTSADYFIFPVEILAWLAIRKEMGLPNYTPNHNELMQLEINRLPEQNIPYPQDELVERCKAKLLADNKGLNFEI